jgi:hypothetical protein
VEGWRSRWSCRAGWTGHQWARAARDLGFLPDVARALGPAGFWQAAPARAYGAAGSFLAYLRERHGAAAVAALYRTGDFEGSLGRPAAALVKDWEAFLDTVDAAGPRQRGAGPLHPPGPLRRALRPGGGGARGGGLRPGRPRAARRGLRGAAPGGGGDRPGRTAAGGGGPAGRRRLPRRGLGRLPGGGARRPGGGRPLPGPAAGGRGRPGGAAANTAAAGWSQALGVDPDRPEARLLQAKLAAVSDPALATAVRPYLLGLEAQGPALARLAEVERPLTDYLRARQAQAKGEADAALPLLERAVAGRLPPLLDREARLLLGEARCQVGAGQATDRLAAGEALLSALSAEATAEADRVRAAAGLRRCRFLAGR